MTAPYTLFKNNLPTSEAPQAADPHDQIFDQLRTVGPGRAPADATAARPPAPRASAKEIGRQFLRGLGESGLQALEMAGSAADIFSGRAALPESFTMRNAVTRALSHTRQQMEETYGTPKTDEELAASFAGNLIGTGALGALGEGVARPIQGILSARRAATAPFKLVPFEDNYPVPRGFESNVLEPGAATFSKYNYNIVDNVTGKPVGSLHGGLENNGKTFFVDMVSASRGGTFSSGVGRLGMRATRDLLRQLQEIHPNITAIAGDRSTGIRSLARASILQKNPPIDQIPKSLRDETVVPLISQEGPFPTFRQLPQTIRDDFARILSEERGSFKWGPDPQPVPPSQMSGRDFDELLNRAYFSRPTGPLVHPAREVLPGLGGVPTKMNRLLASDEMVARGRASRTGRGRLSNDIAKEETRQANNMLRDAIMRNENPMSYESPTLGSAPRDRLRLVDIARFLRGMSKQ